MYEIVNNVKCSILCVNNILYQSDDFALLSIKMGHWYYNIGYKSF